MSNNKINRLREYYSLDCFYSDDDVINITKGSLGEAVVDIHIAKDNLKNALLSAFGFLSYIIKK